MIPKLRQIGNNLTLSSFKKVGRMHIIYDEHISIGSRKIQVAIHPGIQSVAGVPFSIKATYLNDSSRIDCAPLSFRTYIYGESAGAKFSTLNGRAKKFRYYR